MCSRHEVECDQLCARVSDLPVTGRIRKTRMAELGGSDVDVAAGEAKVRELLRRKKLLLACQAFAELVAAADAAPAAHRRHPSAPVCGAVLALCTYPRFVPHAHGAFVAARAAGHALEAAHAALLARALAAAGEPAKALEVLEYAPAAAGPGLEIGRAHV